MPVSMDQSLNAAHGRELSFTYLLSILWRRKWLVTLLTLLSLGVTYGAVRHIRDRWRATAQMVVIQRNLSSTTSPEMAYAAPLLESADTQTSMIESDGMAQRTLDWLKNEALQKRQTLEQLGIKDEMELRRNFTEMVDAKVPKDTNLIVLTANGPTAEQAQTLANAVCQAFVQWKQEIAQASMQEISKNLETRVARAHEKMLSEEQAELAFKKKRHLVDVPSQYKAALDQYLARDSAVAQAKEELGSEEERLRALGEQVQSANAAIRNGTGVRDDSLVQGLQKQLNDLEIERANAALKYTPEYPGVLPNLDAQIKDVQARLAKAVQGTLDNKRPSLQAQDSLFQQYKQTQVNALFLKAKFEGTLALREQAKQQLQGVPEASMEYARLSRNADLARQQYVSLLANMNSISFSNDLAHGNVQLTSQAILPESPYYPNRSRLLLLAGLLGFGTGVLLSLMLESSDRRLRTLSEVRALVPGPIIGTLPRLSHAQTRQMLAGDAPWLTTEAYSLARANLAMIARKALQGDPWDRQVILVTSSVPGEGKSVTAAHIARSLARSGKSVILVDADMRRPSQNRLFNTAEKIGLVDVLTRGVPLEEALVASDTDNLAILHSGIADRSPTELISLPTLPQMLEALRQMADVIIVDAPACVVVADALLLAPHVDCILQVVGVGKVDGETLQETTHALSAAAPKTLVYFVNYAPREARHRAYGKHYAYEPKMAGDLVVVPGHARSEVTEAHYESAENREEVK